MNKISERKKTLEVVLQQKLTELQRIEAARNNLATEVVQIRGKLELLDELQHESSEEDKKEDSA